MNLLQLLRESIMDTHPLDICTWESSSAASTELLKTSANALNRLGTRAPQETEVGADFRGIDYGCAKDVREARIWCT